MRRWPERWREQVDVVGRTDDLLTDGGRAHALAVAIREFVADRRAQVIEVGASDV